MGIDPDGEYRINIRNDKHRQYIEFHRNIEFKN